jgi:hypothetical protein
VEKEKDLNPKPTFKFIHPYEESFWSNGWHMQEIINEVKEGGVQFIDHIASLLCVIVTNVWGIHLSKVNEVMHPNMAFHYMNYDLGNSMHWMKD